MTDMHQKNSSSSLPAERAPVSHALFERARTLLPGGVNSPVRAYGGRGMLIAPSQFEANFLSAAHTEADIAETAAATIAALECAHG